jgi:hypothetical protein
VDFTTTAPQEHPVQASPSRRPVSALGLLAVLCLAAAAAHSHPVPLTPATERKLRAEIEVFRAEFQRAGSQRDAVAPRRLCTDDFTHTHTSGKGTARTPASSA